MLMIGAGSLEQVLGLPVTLMRYTGVSLVPFAIFLAFLATRQLASRYAVWSVILLNVLWTIDSFLILLTGWVTPTQFGYVFVVAQALGVGMLAGLEYVALRKSAAVVQS
jgi:hypothetical protein